MVRRLLPDRVSRGQSQFSLGVGLWEPASVNARSSSPPPSVGRAPPVGDAGPGRASPSAVRQALERPTEAVDTQRTRCAAAAKGGGNFGTATPGRTRSCRRRPGWVRGRGDNAVGLRVSAPTRRCPGSPSPLPAGLAPGRERGAPSSLRPV